MKKVIIIGATSGIGEAIAQQFAIQKYTLGLTGRRYDKLQSLQNNLPTQVYIAEMDVQQTTAARQQFHDLIQEMGGVDIVIINAGVGVISTQWDKELDILMTNVVGFIAIANAAFSYFQREAGGQGQIVGISSVAAERGGATVPVYNASKACISSYMEGLRLRAKQKKLNISVTDIRPGFVETPMTEQNDFMFWVASPEKAAKQIITATQHRKKVAYITKRWRLVAWLLHLLPDSIAARTS